MSDDNNEENERHYIDGKRRAYIDIIHACARGMGLDNEQMKTAALLTERAEAVAALRDLCERFGDNDWPDNLHLRDVIEKHLAPHLESAE